MPTPVQPESEGKRAVRKFLGMMTPGEMVQQKQDGKPEVVEEIQEEPSSKLDEDVEKRLVEQLRAIDSSDELTYEERLRQLGVTLEEAAKIVDDILSKGFYEQEFALSKKHSVTLRTRGVEDQERLQESMENNVPRYAITANEMTARHNLAASLAEFNGTKFKMDEFKKAYTFVGKLPLPVFNALVTRLAKFDAVMYNVLSEGAAENF